MKVYDFYGEYQCTDIDQLMNRLQVRSKHMSNDYELRHEAGYPLMAILVKDALACVHFFKDENDAGCYAFTGAAEQTKDENIVFNLGSEDAETVVSYKMVISVEKAYTVAKAFFNTSQMSSDVEWYQL